MDNSDPPMDSDDDNGGPIKLFPVSSLQDKITKNPNSISWSLKETPKAY